MEKSELFEFKGWDESTKKAVQGVLERDEQFLDLSRGIHYVSEYSFNLLSQDERFIRDKVAGADVLIDQRNKLFPVVLVPKWLELGDSDGS